jgi:pyridoxine 4-dehydrogenase
MSVPLTFTFKDGRQIHRLGYGAMRLTGQPGNFGPYVDWERGKEVLQKAIDLGIDFVDTARAYGPAWNERLVADALHPYPSQLFIATKGGVVKKSATERHLDCSPNGLRRDCAESLKNLRVEAIDLYQMHWVDPDVNFLHSIRALKLLQDEGRIRRIGLSNVTQDEVESAERIVAIDSVQNRYNILERDSDPLIEYCERRGIAFLPYGPLGADPMKAGAPLARAPDEIARVAAELGASTTQVSLAWLLRRSPNILPIPGTTSLAHLEENWSAQNLSFSEDQLARLNRAITK